MTASLRRPQGGRERCHDRSVSQPRYIVHGGQPVSGRIRSLGAKNFATKAMVAALLADGRTRLLNAPRIGDVEITCDLLAAACGFAHLMLLVPRHAPEPGAKDGNAA